MNCHQIEASIGADQFASGNCDMHTDIGSEQKLRKTAPDIFDVPIHSQFNAPSIGEATALKAERLRQTERWRNA